MHALAVVNVSLYNLFQISKQARMSSKAMDDDHNQLSCHTVINNKISVGVNIKLKFGWVKQKKGISLMLVIRLGAGCNMRLPEVYDGLRIGDPVVFGRVTILQL